MTRPGIGRRLFLTVWLVSAAHLTTNVVRETYLAVALAERATVRVDPYLGLNPDLFEIPGRGAFINSNPGASFLGAIPYAGARPFLEALYRARPGLVAPKPPASYDDPRGNRTRFMNAMRERGLDIRLALAAISIQLALMAPLSALSALLLFRFLGARGVDQRRAVGLALLYALGTPILFRTAYLNQNVLLAHAVLFSWLLLRWPGPGSGRPALRWLGAGLLLGVGVLCDYSAVPISAVFAIWAAREGWLAGGARGAAERVGFLALGAAVPLALLLGYQLAAFGNPWLPAQSYMPETDWSRHGWHGMTLPSLDLLWRNLLDPSYGLFVFCPLLLLAFAAPWLRNSPAAPSREDVALALLASAALWIFESANQFANMQFNSGVRYMVPAVPLLFLLAAPVLLELSRNARWGWIAPTLVVAWSVSMMRESVPLSLRILFTDGPTLPVLRTLEKTSTAYAPLLARGLQPWGTLSVLLLAFVIALIWRRSPWDPASPRRHSLR